MSDNPYQPSAPVQQQPYQPLPPQGYGVPQGYGHPQGSQPPPTQYAQPPSAYSGQVHVPVYQPNVGPCAAGGGHSIKEEFTACGLVCGILLFPIGLICCLTMKDRTCMRCGMKFD